MPWRASMKKIVPSRAVAVAALQLTFATSWTHSRVFLWGPERDLSLPAVAGVKGDVCAVHRPLQVTQQVASALTLFTVFSDKGQDGFV